MLVRRVILQSIIYLFFFFQSWDSFFRNASAGAGPGQAYQAPPSLAVPGKHEIPVTALVPQLSSSSVSAGLPANEKLIDDHLAVQAIIRSYQVTHSYIEGKFFYQGPGSYRNKHFNFLLPPLSFAFPPDFVTIDFDRFEAILAPLWILFKSSLPKVTILFYEKLTLVRMIFISDFRILNEHRA